MVIKPENIEVLRIQLKSKKLVLYGMGTMGKAIAKWCDSQKIDYIFADRNFLEKQKSTSKLVINPEQLNTDYKDANIVISSNLHYDEIVKKLKENGFLDEQLLAYNIFLPQNIVWSDLDDNIDWNLMKPSVELFSEWIDNEVKSLVDYGAGQMYLKNFLAEDVKYYPIDYIRRFDETIVCDLNSGNFPDIKADASICNGVLEFLITAENLLKNICKNTSQIIIISYMTLDKFPSIDGRRASAYVSDLTENDIINILKTGGFKLVKKAQDPLDSTDTIYLFRRQR